MTKSAAARRRARARKRARVAQPKPSLPQANVVRGRPSRRVRKRNRRMGKLVTAPIAVAPQLMTSPVGELIASGTDYLDLIPVSTKVSDGAIVGDFRLGPYGALADTHFSQLAKAHERYRFDAFEVDVVTRVPTTIGGGYIVGITPDVQAVVPSGVGAKRFLRALPGAVSSPWWMSAAVTMDVSRSDRWYFVNADSVEEYRTQQGRVLIVVDGPPTMSTGDLHVSLQIRWRARFAAPVVDVESMAVNDLELKIGDLFKSGFAQSDGNAFYWPSSEAYLWKKAKFNMVYNISPPLIYSVGSQHYELKACQLGATRAGSWMVGFFSSLEAAFKVGNWSAMPEEKRPGITPQEGENVIVTVVTLLEPVGSPAASQVKAIKPSRLMVADYDTPDIRLSSMHLNEQIADLVKRFTQIVVETIQGHAVMTEIIGGEHNLAEPPTVVVPARGNSVGSWEDVDAVTP